MKKKQAPPLYVAIASQISTSRSSRFASTHTKIYSTISKIFWQEDYFHIRENKKVTSNSLKLQGYIERKTFYIN